MVHRRCYHAVSVTVIAQMISLGGGVAFRPGPGMWPLFVAMVVLAAIPFALQDKSDTESYQASSLARPALMAAALLAFVPLYPLLGFIATTFLTMGVIARWVCRESWLSSVAVSLATPVVAYLLFGMVFKVVLSPFPTWLGF